MSSVKDPNPIYDPGSPRSTAGTNSAAYLCDILEIPLEIMAPQDDIVHGWGQDGLGAQPVIGTWELNTQDRNHNNCTLIFDILPGTLPIIIGLDVDTAYRAFSTYIATESEHAQCERIRLLITPRPRKSITALVSVTLLFKAKRDPKVFAKRVHRLTHAPSEQIKSICNQAGILDSALDKAIDKVADACGICASSGRPATSNKISLTHVNEAFNMEAQVDLAFETVRGVQRTIFLITDTGTTFSEGTITNSRDISSACNLLEILWIMQHGAPASISADDEYNRRQFRALLDAHSITFKPRPTRRHNKTGIIERKVQTIKEIIRKLDKEITNSNANDIIRRSIFLSNLFSGSRMLSSFQLARGYQPSILGIAQSVVPQELLNAHIEQTATRALQRAMRTNTSNNAQQSAYQPGDKIWVWYKSTKGNERKEWILATVIATPPHFIEAKRIADGKAAKGRAMKPSYEDVRLAPQSAITQELMSCTLEEELGMLTDGGEDNSRDGEQHPPNITTLLTTSHNDTAQNITYDTDIEMRTESDDPAQNEDHTDNDNTMMDIDRRKKEVSGPPAQICELHTDKPKILDNIFNTIGSQQVTKHKLEFAPSWIIEEAYKSEHYSNWAEAYEPIDEQDVPADANIVNSHVVYKVKTDEEGERMLKARICPHGNEDDEKESIRKDSANAQLAIVRLLLSLVTFLNFTIKTADIKGAYLQSGPIKREIFVRPPKEWHEGQHYGRGKIWRILWKLTKLPYGIVEAGRQWMLTVEHWMLEEAVLQRVLGVNQLFAKRSESGSIRLLVAKLSDDFLVAGKKEDIKEFMEQLKQRFVVGKIVDGPIFNFGGCEVTMHRSGDIVMSMRNYWKRVKPILMTRTRRRMRDALASASEIIQYRSLCGTLLYLGSGTLPQAALVVSLMQQRIGRLTVSHIVEANEMTEELRRLDSIITFRCVTNPTDIVLCSFSDASHPKDRDYGQTGNLTGILSRNGTEEGDVLHLIDWSPHKQQRISHSSYGAEILAAATADDRGFYLKQAINTLFPKSPLKHELNVDSKALWDTITTLHDGKEYRLRQTVQRIRNSFESQGAGCSKMDPGKEQRGGRIDKTECADAQEAEQHLRERHNGH